MAAEQSHLHGRCELRATLLCLVAVLLCCPAVTLANEPASVSMDTLVDPTRPVAFVGTAGKTEDGEQKLLLQAIFFGDSRREAVINGRTVKVGETIDQARIIAIAPGRVSYARNGVKGELVLLPKVLKPARGED